MYVFRMRRLSQNQLNELEGLTLDYIEAKYPSCITVPEDKVKEYGKSAFADLLPYMGKIRYKTLQLNEGAIKRELGLPEHFRLKSYTQNIETKEWKLVWHDRNDLNNTDNMIEMSIPNHKITRHWLIGLSAIYIADREKVGYWRKMYSIRDELHKATKKKIENSKYYKVNKEMCKLLVRYGLPEIYSREDIRKDLLYMESY